MRFFILFFWFLSLTILTSATTRGNQGHQVCIRLVGVVQDFTTHKPLAANLSVRSGSSRATLGSSADGTGRFAVDLTCTASLLLIERTGYRPQRLPLNLSTLASASEVYVVIPLVATDQQGADRPYLQTEQKHYVQPGGSSSTGQVQHNTFAVTDALTGTPLQAQVCFFFTKTGIKKCLDTDATGQCKTDFTDKDIVAMEVRATGYQAYQGNISVEQLGGPVLSHTVRLIRELNVLTIQSEPVQPGLSVQSMLRREGSKTPVLMASSADRPGVFTTYDVLPNRYELLLLDKQKTVLHRQVITVSPGLNVQTITLPAPKLASSNAKPVALQPVLTPVAAATTGPGAGPVLADNLPMLFFDEGSYLLSDAARTILQQVGTYLKQHPDINLRLVGHTDRLGDERLNQYLGEFRAKVAANYLYWQGVADERLQIVGYGSRFMVGTDVTSESRGRNRRVTLRFVPARPTPETNRSLDK
ncbi:OmpA family protein [uncultured Fibrella sp.]|uniref:OmpA family protein n=1 Tax=uncultured Fibrella sp. TaxID=1284596 RepID=UPI0035C97915